MIVGLTGGIGCGKSTVGRLFAARGFRRLDSDVVMRERILADPTVIRELVARFGATVVAGRWEREPAGVGREDFLL
jgi:dephospho-CoA kinase